MYIALRTLSYLSNRRFRACASERVRALSFLALSSVLGRICDRARLTRIGQGCSRARLTVLGQRRFRAGLIVLG